jgi:hypothetical protein
MAIGADGLGPVFPGEEGCDVLVQSSAAKPDQRTDVIVKEKGEMVGDEVLAADTEVERVKVLEFSPHALERGLGNARLLDNVFRELGTAEDVVPNFVNHVFGGDVGLATIILLTVGIL